MVVFRGFFLGRLSFRGRVSPSGNVILALQTNGNFIDVQLGFRSAVHALRHCEHNGILPHVRIATRQSVTCDIGPFRNRMVLSGVYRA